MQQKCLVIRSLVQVDFKDGWVAVSRACGREESWGGRYGVVTVMERCVGRIQHAQRPFVIRVPRENSSSLAQFIHIKLHSGQNSDSRRKCLSSTSMC